jgi:hypothetical protein
MTIPALILALASAELLAQEDGDDSRRRRRGMRERMMRDDDAPKVGDVAPVFTLKSLDGKSETSLASFKGRKPVLLFFGSYT